MKPLLALEAVWDVVEKNQHRPFLIDSVHDRIINYGEFAALACSVARRLRGMGIGQGDRVVIVLHNCSEFPILYFACLFLGTVAVPVNPLLHKREIEFILKNSGANAVIFSPTTKDRVSDVVFNGPRPHLVCLQTDSRDVESSEAQVWAISAPSDAPNDSWRPFQGVSPESLYSITFTSGTTSVPKGVPHRIDSLLSNAMLFNTALGFGPDNRFYHVLPMSYMAGFLNTLLSPFMAGASVVIGRAFDARLAIQFWDAPLKYGVDTLWLVPTILSTLLRIDRNVAGHGYCQNHIKTICVGTAPLPLKLKKEWEEKYGVTLFESYGLSETLFVTTNCRTVRYLPGSVGPALPGIHLRVVDDGGRELSVGETGEIEIQTPFLMAGYLNYDTQQPDSGMLSEWVPTGDIGRLGREGHLFVTDRKKDLIIRGGVNISPRAVEDVLMRHETVLQAIVVGLPHEFYGEEVVAVVKLKEGNTLEAAQPLLVSLCKENLSAASVPTRFVLRTEFPVNTTGKIQKGKLREQLIAELATGANTHS